MPAIHTVLSNTTNIQQSIQVLVISPTRELATQITTQAQQMLTFHQQLSVQIIMGGTNMKTDVSRFSNKLPTILVATPGRMKDHLENTILKNGTKFGANCLSELKVLVLDEADQLLEMGFRQDIFKILSFLPPPENRQTLLFSATMPKDLREVMARAMKPSYVTVDCIHDYGNDNNNNNNETNAHVQQTHVILPPGMDRLVVSVLEVTLQAMKQQDNYKIIAFFPTARLVGYFAELVNDGIRKRNAKSFPEIVEIHSRKSQANRNKASDRFRAAKCAILFTSDVSARGVDYPGVTTVIQFGLPDSREQYIHRLGRTGRAGKAGKGWLVLANYERTFLRELQGGPSGGVDVPADDELQALFSAPPSPQVMDMLTPVLQDIGNGSNEQLVKSAQQAYQAWLGFYKDRTRRMVGNKSKAEMVQMANRFAQLCGLSEQPTLLKKTVGKMGLKGVPGIKTTNAL
jgi:ATP-dependent RNA helicase MSS116